MKTFEKLTLQDNTNDIDHEIKSSNNHGLSWFVNASHQAGTAKLVIVTSAGAEHIVQSDSVASGTTTLISYDFAVPSHVICRWTPGGSSSSTLTSLITIKPSR